jgi:hypothetical protein
MVENTWKIEIPIFQHVKETSTTLVVLAKDGKNQLGRSCEK